MMLNKIIRRLVHPQIIGVLMLLGLVWLLSLKYYARQEDKARQGYELSPPGSWLYSFSNEVSLNPVNLWKQVTGEKRSDAPEMVPRPTSKLMLLDEAKLGIDNTLLYGYYDYDKDEFRTVYKNLKTGKDIHTWRFEYQKLAEIYTQWFKLLPSQATTESEGLLLKAGLVHPLLLPNGNLVVHLDYNGPLLCFDPKGNIVWQVNQKNLAFHHSIEYAPDGSIWTCANKSLAKDTKAEKEGEPAPTFWLQDMLVQVDAKTGNVLFQKRLEDIFQDNPVYDLSTLTREQRDLYHINDVQPVPGDGPYWQTGDVFISTRHLNAITLYRPDENKIIWQKMTGWSSQHDVEFVNDSTISIFNNAYVRSRPKGYFNRPSSQFVTYNFGTGETKAHFTKTFEEYDVKTTHSGQTTFLPADSILHAESTDDAFLIISDLKQKKTYRLGQPGYMPNTLQYINWARLMPRDTVFSRQD